VVWHLSLLLTNSFNNTVYGVKSSGFNSVAIFLRLGTYFCKTDWPTHLDKVKIVNLSCVSI